MTPDEDGMRLALQSALAGLEKGELPVGAAITVDDDVCAVAHTSEKADGRYLVHAELQALLEFDKLRMPISRRRKAVLFTTVEPCLMCLGAAMSAFVGTVVYSLSAPSDGSVALAAHLNSAPDSFQSYVVPVIRGGVLSADSRALIERYVAAQPAGPMRSWAKGLLETAP